MKINKTKLLELGACKEGVEMFRRYPGLKRGRAELGALCRWAASEGKASYVFWLLPRLMTPEGTVRWTITTAKRHCADADWNKWADGWLSGEDRTEKSAEATWTAAGAATWTAARAAVAVARTAVRVAEAAQVAWMAEADWAAAWAAEYAYDAAEDKTAEIECQIADALEIIGKEKAE